MRIPSHIAELHPNEIIVRVIHRHWFNIASHFSVLGTISVLVLVGFFFLPTLGESASLVFIEPLVLFFETTLLLLLWVYGFVVWINYYFDVWVVTNQRVINIEQKGLFERVTSELDLARIQDVTANVSGLIPTFLDFGDVLIQTAGEQRHFTFRNIPCPDTCKNEIMHLAKQLS